MIRGVAFKLMLTKTVVIRNCVNSLCPGLSASRPVYNLCSPGVGAAVSDGSPCLLRCLPSRQDNGSPCGQFRARPEVGCGALPADGRPH